MGKSPVAFKDCNSSPAGLLSIRIKDKNGDVISEYTDKNMIMTASKGVLARLIGGDGGSSAVTQVVVGNNDTLASPDNTSIGGIPTSNLSAGMNVLGGQNVAFLKTLDTHTYPSEGRVSFSWSLDYGEANGLEIYEYGLVCADLTLFSRKTRGIITKSAGMAMDGEWTIIF